MNIINSLISQLNSATSDPVVKILVICVSALIVVIIFTLIINTIKGLIRAITKPFLNKKKERETRKSLPSAPQQKVEAQPTIKTSPDQKDEPAACLQDAHATIQKLNNKASELVAAPSETKLPTPIVIDEKNPSFSEDMLLDLEYTENLDDKKEQIIKSIKGKGLQELEVELSLITIATSNAQTSLNINKNNFLGLINEHNELSNIQDEAVKEFNQEIEKVQAQAASLNNTKKVFLSDIKSHKTDLLALVNALTIAEKELENVKNQLALKTSEAKDFVDSIKAVSFQHSLNEENGNKLIEKLREVEKKSNELTANEKEINALKSEIYKNSEEIAENNIKLEVIENTIAQLKEAEKLLAEQRAKEEAEARKAKIEEEARRLEEEHRLEEEKRKREAQLEAERAEQLRKQQEQKREEELLNAQKEQTTPQPTTNIPYTNQSEPLTEEQEAEQARAMMEAQRARRKKSAKTSVTPPVEDASQPSIPVEPSSSDNNLTLTVEKKEDKPTIEPEIVKNVTTEEENKPTPERPSSAFVDPMAKIKAEWEREHDIQEALKAGDVDAAINLANKKGS